jgi:hypothetical protein
VAHCLPALRPYGRVACILASLRDRFAIVMLSVRVGERALPVRWTVEAGAANVGFEAQRQLRELGAG